MAVRVAVRRTIKRLRDYYWPQPTAKQLRTLGRVSHIHRAQAIGARRQARTLLIGFAATCGLGYAVGGVTGLMTLPLGLLVLTGFAVMAAAVVTIFTH